MVDEDDNEVPSVIHFFSNRAKLVPRVAAEEFKATSELISKMQEEHNEVLLSSEKMLPPVKKARIKRAKKVPSKSEEIIEEIVTNSPPSPDIVLSAAAKRRLKKLQKEQEMELKEVEAANRQILSAVELSEYKEVEEVSVDDFDNVNVLTISYMSAVSRLKCYDCEKFSAIFPRVAELFKMKPSEFLLCYKEQIIKVDDTPKSLNITNSDILEIIPYKADESSEVDIQYDVNSLKIIFQSSDSKEKVNMFVHKLEKMQDIMEKYSKLRDIPLNLLIFEFDGEKISGAETPEDLDMESGICIDVTVLTPTKKKMKENEIVTVDSDSNDSYNSNDSDILICD